MNDVTRQFAMTVAALALGLCSGWLCAEFIIWLLDLRNVDNWEDDDDDEE